MKNEWLKKVSIVLLIFLPILLDGAEAGDSFSFSVSCTIPAIPGLNAPPFIEEKTVKVETDKTVEQVKQEKEKQEEEIESPSIIQEDIDRETQLVRTIYSR